MPRPATISPSRTALRVLLCLGVGCFAVPVGTFAVTAALFIGSVVAAVGLLVAVVAAVALVLAGIHRATIADQRRAGLAGDVGWGAAVAVVSIVLVGGFALAWQIAGRTFGPHPLLWWLLGGSAFALVGAAGTRRTALPASVAVAALVAVAVVLSGQRPLDPVVAQQARQQRQDERAAAHRALTFTYVTDLAGYDQGNPVEADTLSGVARMYVPLDELPLDGAGPDHSVVLTAQEPGPAPCGRAERLPFDDTEAATCEDLAPGVFHRVAERYHEVVLVEPDVVVSARGVRDVPVEVLRRAVTEAHLASRAQIERWNRGASWLPGSDADGAPAIDTPPRPGQLTR